MFKTLTQGGQVHIHQLRMLKQVFIFGLLVTFLAGGGFFVWSCYSLPTSLWRATLEVTKAKALLATTFELKQDRLTQLYTPLQSKIKPYRRKCVNILKDPVLLDRTQDLISELKIAAWKSLSIGGISFLLLMLFWLMRGRAYRQTQHQRGATCVSLKTLKRLIQKNKDASDLTIGEVPLLKNKETSHLLMTGTTGSGKTTLFHTLLPQIRRRGDRAIVVDSTGDFIARYYDETRDIILNPFDARSLSWDPWADCQTEPHYDVLSHALIQPKERSQSDPFWDNASRKILKTALQKFAEMEHKDAEDLYQFLVSSSDREFCKFFKSTEAASLLSLSNAKTMSSIRSVLSSQIEGLKFLETTKEEGFSVRNWVTHEPQGWLFLTATPDQRKTLTPLISTWVEIAINALMSLPQDPKRRLWFIMDELAALQKLPSLQTGLAEARKYGGCFLVGFQSKPQLEETYGDKASHAMLDLFNTKVFFRCTEPSTQLWISRILGDVEESEPASTISYGAHSMRDGVSLTHHHRHKPLIMPAELSQLEDLEGYVKLPGGYPCTKVRMARPSFLAKKIEAFILRET